MPFAETFAAFQAAREEYYATAKSYGDGLRAEQEAYFKKRFPKRRKIDLDAVKDEPEFAAIFDRWKYKADAFVAAFEERKKALEAKLDAEATEEIPATTILGQVYTVSASSYATQGLGASRYAEKAAEAKADIARHHGFHAEVIPVGSEFRTRDGCSYQDYAVFANVTEIGWEMLMRRPGGPSLREWIKNCWKRGVNPRVFHPMLPHGLEEKFGIDYFGNDKPAVQV